MAKTFDVIVVGDYCLDLIFTGLPKFPELGIEVVSQGFEMLPGGTYNTAISLHRLGVKVGWAGDFGTDDFSQFILDWVKKEGLDPSLFSYHKRPLRRITVAVSYPQERAFIAYYDPDPSVPAALSALAINHARALYIPGIFHGSAFDLGLKLVRAKGMKIIMDGNSPEEDTLGNPKVEKAIKSLDIFMPNAREAARLTGEPDPIQSLRILAELCPLVVLKDGANGAFTLIKGEILHEPGLKLTPVDTTGAGDCFNAGFIKAWLEGHSLRACLRWGNIVGGLSTLAPGISRVINEAEVRQHLAA